MAAATHSNDGPAIGIDLGTTYSCVAVVRNQKVDVIPNEQGKVTTPSFVSFTEHERMIGYEAKQQLAANSANTIFDAKRLIGRKFNDPIVQMDMRQWPFKVVDVNNLPKIEITYKNELKRFSPEEISAMILGKMKEIAESYLNANVTNAVVTVPAYFNDMQRKATKDAGTIAGLNVLRIINEPTAAAIAYGLTNDMNIAKNILIYDFGGGTFDVSILNIHENSFQVKATAGDSHLGGEDFDNRMMETFIAEFKRKNGLDISGNRKSLRRLRTACERAKRALSSTMQTFIEIDSLYDGIDFMECVTRIRFEDMCADLFQLTIKIVKGALKDADLKCEDIDTIVLVGGSTRIPKLQQLLRDLFEGKEICKTINADEAVAQGAAIQAAILHGGATTEMKNMKLMEVTPLTLGVAARPPDLKGTVPIMYPIIKRNTPIPVFRSEKYYTAVENQTTVSIHIIQGERPMAAENFEIGHFRVAGIPAAPIGVEKVTITFTIDENGILTVTALSETNPMASGQLTIKNVCGSLTGAEIEQMIADAKRYLELDRDVKQHKTARWDLEQYCIEIQNKYGSERSFIREKCEEMQTWLNNCCRPTINQFRQWKDELKSLTLPPNAKKIKHENYSTSDVCLPVKDEKNAAGHTIDGTEATSSTHKIEEGNNCEDMTAAIPVSLPIKKETIEIDDDDDDDEVIILSDEKGKIYVIDD